LIYVWIIYFKFQCHLIEDHAVLSDEVDGLVQLVIEANNEDILYNNNSKYILHINSSFEISNN